MSGVGDNGVFYLTNNETPEEANKVIGEYNKAHGTNFGWAKPAGGETDLTASGAKVRDADVIQKADGSFGIGQEYNKGFISNGRDPELAKNEGARIELSKDGKINVFGTDNFINSNSFKQFKDVVDKNIAGKVSADPATFDKIREMFNSAHDSYEKEAQYNRKIQKAVDRQNREQGLNLSADKYKESLSFANKLQDGNIKDDDEITLGNMTRKKSEWKSIFNKDKVGSDEEFEKAQRLLNIGQFKGDFTTDKLANISDPTKTNDAEGHQIYEQMKNISQALKQINPDDANKLIVGNKYENDNDTHMIQGFKKDVSDEDKQRIINEINQKIKANGGSTADMLRLNTDQARKENIAYLRAAKDELDKAGLWNEGGALAQTENLLRTFTDAMLRTGISAQAVGSIAGLAGIKPHEDSGLLARKNFLDNFHEGKVDFYNISNGLAGLAGGIVGMKTDDKIFEGGGGLISKGGASILKFANGAKGVKASLNIANGLANAGLSDNVIQGILNAGDKVINKTGKGIEFTGDVLAGEKALSDIKNVSNTLSKAKNSEIIFGKSLSGIKNGIVSNTPTSAKILGGAGKELLLDMATEIPRAQVINKMHEISTGKKDDDYSLFASSPEKYVDRLGETFQDMDKKSVAENVLNLSNFIPALRGGVKSFQATKAFQEADKALASSAAKVREKINNTEWKKKFDTDNRGVHVRTADNINTKIIAEGVAEGDPLYTMGVKAQLDANDLHSASRKMFDDTATQIGVKHPLSEDLSRVAKENGIEIKPTEVKNVNGKKIGVRFIDPQTTADIYKISDYEQTKGKIERDMANGKKPTKEALAQFEALQKSISEIDNLEGKRAFANELHEAFRNKTKIDEALGIRPENFLSTIDQNGNFKGYVSKSYINKATGEISDGNISTSAGKIEHKYTGGIPEDPNMELLDPISALKQGYNSSIRHTEYSKVRALLRLNDDLGTATFTKDKKTGKVSYDIDVNDPKYSALKPDGKVPEINPDKTGIYRDNNLFDTLTHEDRSQIRDFIGKQLDKAETSDPATLYNAVAGGEAYGATIYAQRRMNQGFTATQAFQELAHNHEVSREIAQEVARGILGRGTDEQVVKVSDSFNRMFKTPDLPPEMNAVQNQLVETLNKMNAEYNPKKRKALKKQAQNYSTIINLYRAEQFIKTGEIDFKNKSVITRNTNDFLKLNEDYRKELKVRDKAQDLLNTIKDQSERWGEITNTRLGLARDMAKVILSPESSKADIKNALETFAKTNTDEVIPKSLEPFFNKNGKLKSADLGEDLLKMMIKETETSLTKRFESFDSVIKNSKKIIAEQEAKLDKLKAKKQAKLELIEKNRSNIGGEKAIDFQKRLKNTDESIEQFKKQRDEALGKEKIEDVYKLNTEIAKLYESRNKILEDAHMEIQKSRSFAGKTSDKIAFADTDEELVNSIQKGIKDRANVRSEFYEKLGNEKAESHEAIRQAEQDIEGKAYVDSIAKTSIDGESETFVDSQANKALLEKYIAQTRHMSGEDLTGVKKAMSFLAQKMSATFRATTTGINPIAGARNAVRDTIQSVLMTGGQSAGAAEFLLSGIKPRGKVNGHFKFNNISNVDNLTKSLVESWGAPYDEARKYAQQLLSVADDTFNHIHGRGAKAIGEEYINNLTNGKIKKAFSTGYDWFTKPNDTIEKVSRIANIKAGLEEAYSKGLDFKSAVAKAEFVGRNATADFRAMNIRIRSLSRSTSYLNAAFSGSRSFRLMAERNPLTLITNLLTYGVAPMVALTANNMNDRNRDAYQNIPDWVKESNIVMMYGDNKAVFLPIPQEFQPFYGTIEGIVSGRYKNVKDYASSAIKLTQPWTTLDFSALADIDPNQGDILGQLAKNAGKTLSPLAPDAVKLGYEALTGKSLFFGSDTYNTAGKAIEDFFGIDSTTKEGKFKSRQIYSIMKAFGGMFTDNVINILDGMKGIDKNDRAGFDMGKQFKRTFYRDIGANGEKGAKYDYMNSKFQDAMSKLEDEKERVSDKLENIDKKIRQAGKDENLKAKLEKEREEISNAFGKKVESSLKDWQKQWENNKYFVWDSKKEKQVVNLLLPKGQTLIETDDDLDEDQKQLYYATRDKAINKYLSMGLPVNPTSELLFNKSLSDIRGAPSKMLNDIDKIKKQKIAGTDQTLKQKYQEYMNKINEIRSSKQKLGKDDYKQIENLRREYTETYFAPATRALSEEYTPYLIGNNKRAIRELADVAMVPDDWMVNNRGRRDYGGKREDLQAGYIQSYIRNLWGGDKDSRKISDFQSDPAVVRTIDKIESMKKSGDISGALALKKRLNIQLGNGSLLLNDEQSKRLQNLKI